ncbi:high-affnity carbon uptake protein hat/hatR [Streptomyces sp. NL15-2K]|nr:high-affnity carbon uptake protein hat/hatR [Streptomyces sp. NL15-2K]
MVGAGFFAGEGVLVTCAHVVTKAGGGPGARIRLAFPHAPGAPQVDGEVLAGAWRAAEDQDVAVLRVDQVPDGVPLLRLDSAAGCRGHRVCLFGFPPQAPPGGQFGWGEAGHLLDVAGAGMTLQLTGANDLTTGFSGGPVLDEVTGRVIGMLSAVAPPDPLLKGLGIAYATPTQVLREVYPGLKVEAVSPYRHLDPFTVEDAKWFHGRGAAVQLVLDSLAEYRGALLLGPSGSGKSSLVQAGVLPALAAGRLAGSDRWLPVYARPGRDLMAALERVLPAAGAEGIVAAAGRRVAAEPGCQRLLLVIDQFEELLTGPGTGGQPPDGFQAVIEQVTAAIRTRAPVSVVLVMRDDFYPHLAALAPDLLEAAPRPVNVPATLSAQDLRDIITQPADSAGARFEEGLPDRIITDILTGDRPGILRAPVTLLPPLELALSQLWERRSDGYLTHQAYDAIGEITGSLATWCNAALDRLPDRQQPIAQRILAALVRPADDAHLVPAVRQQEPLDNLRAVAADHTRTVQAGEPSGRDVDDVLAALTGYRIITTRTERTDGQPAAGQPVAELIHDALIRDWPELRQWVAQGHRFHDWLRRTTEQQLRWKESQNPNDLLRGTDLDEGRDWESRRALPREIADFLAASHRAERSQISAASAQISRNRRMIAALTALAVLAVAAAVGAGFAAQRARHAEAAVRAETAVAVSRQLAVEALTLDSTDPYTARQLAVAARTVSGTDQARRTEAALLNEQRGTIITPHRDIHSVSFSPDGSALATAGRDGTVRLWNPTAQKQIGGTITAADGANVSKVVFSPDGTTVATAGDNGSVRLWSAATHRQIGSTMTASGNRTAVLGLAFNPSGTLLASAGSDGSVRLWNPATQQQVGTITAANDTPASSVAFSPKGALLATGDANGRVRLWDPATRQQVGTAITATSKGTVGVTFDPKGTLLATAGGDGTVRLWNPENQRKIGTTIKATTTGSIALGMTFNPDGTRLATGGIDGTVRLWNPATQRQVGSTIAVTSTKSVVWDMSFNPSGTLLATGGADGTVRLWDPATQHQAGSSITAPDNGSPLSDVAFSPSGALLATAGADGTVRLWDPATQRQMGNTITATAGGRPVSDVAFSPSGALLATAGADGTVRLWDPATQHQVGTAITATAHGGVTSVAFNRSGTVLVTGDDHGSVRSWNPVTHRPIGTAITATGYGTGVTSVVFSPSGALLATAGGDGTVRLWDPAAPQQVGTPITAGAAISDLAFSPSGALLATAGGDGTVRLWDPATQRQAGTPITPTSSRSPVWDVAFSPNGAVLAVAVADGSVQFWNPATQQPLSAGADATANGDGAVFKVAFNPQGTVLATANGNGSATLINVSQHTDPHRYMCDAFGLPPASVWSQFAGASMAKPARC